jgi:AmmeMemoRadiSam system protein B/AmmeMemoRadiSam system protein A
MIVLCMVPWGRGESTREGLKAVREPAVVGMFYPKDPEKLRRIVEDSLKSAVKEKFGLPIKAIMAPHAGYVYCSKSMAAAYKQIEGASFTYDRVVVIGPCHGMPTKAAALSSAETWRTPLGPVPVDTELTDKLARMSDRIEFDDRAHAREHSLEVQLPYLSAAAAGKPFKIVPVVTNSSDPADHRIVAQALIRFASGPRTLIVLSTDLSHFPNASDAKKSDGAILKAVESLDAKEVIKENQRLLRAGYSGLEVTMCGLEAVLCFELAAEGLGISHAKQVSYTNSAMAGGNDRRVVGYGAVIFTGAGKGAGNVKTDAETLRFDDESRKELSAMAREAVKKAVAGDSVTYDPTDNPQLQTKAGCFVTLKNGGRLRGCIGRFTSDEPLWRTVREMAAAAATRDTRFRADPITPSEVPKLDLEVSVLSPLREVKDPLKEIELGRDGIVIRDKGRSGTFLPQVADETGWSLEEFLGHCSRDKAGLGWDGWKSPTARIFAYRVTIVHEGK